MNTIAQIVRSLNATSTKAIDDVTAAQLAPVIAEARKTRKGNDIANEFVLGGASTASAPTIVSDMRALGEYLATYPQDIAKLATAGGKIWRNLLCAARRGHNLKGGGVKGAAVTQILATHGGIAARQVKTALNVLATHKDQLEMIENELRGNTQVATAREELPAPPAEVIVDVAPELVGPPAPAAKKGRSRK